MTTAADEDTAAVAARRATVAQLRKNGRSLRDIADEVGVSKDTVRRDLASLSRDTATPSDQDRRTPVAPDAPDVAHPSATPVSRLADLSRDTAAPPAPCLTVPLDQALIADLATLTRNGTSPEAAIRRALALVAGTYRQAWDAGLYPRTADPVVNRHQYAPYQPPAPAPDAGTAHPE
ncbi:MULTISPECIES: helix-turn-helix domain-containing protein [unclassified Streptomyces]|uniref:helix-turn-helix domain-containing protein n=1 Tax=unclassified Streptomyces TaxID=2593676 RepID=UPI0035D60738